MKRSINFTLALSLVFALSILFTNASFAQQKGTGTPKGQGKYFVDQNGDGICDNLGTHVGQKAGNAQKAKGFGPADGTGNKGQGPADGTGNGSGNGKGTGVCTGAGAGSGVCDGTGPKGNGRGGRK